MKSFTQFILENYSPHWLAWLDDTESKSPEYLAVQAYQNGYMNFDVQKYLRKSGKLSNTSKEHKAFIVKQIAYIDNVFKNSKPIKEGSVLWRGTYNHDAKYYTDKFIDLGFVSTAEELNSTVKLWATDGGKILKLIINDRIPGIDVNMYLRSQDIEGEDQQEIILPRGLTFTLIEESKKYSTYSVTK